MIFVLLKKNQTICKKLVQKNDLKLKTNESVRKTNESVRGKGQVKKQISLFLGGLLTLIVVVIFLKINFFAKKEVEASSVVSVEGEVGCSASAPLDINDFVAPVEGDDSVDKLDSKALVEKDKLTIALDSKLMSREEVKKKTIFNYNGNNCLINALYHLWLPFRNLGMKIFSENLEKMFSDIFKAENEDEFCLIMMKIRLILTVKEDVLIKIEDVCEKYRKSGYVIDFVLDIPLKKIDGTSDNLKNWIGKFDELRKQKESYLPITFNDMIGFSLKQLDSLFFFSKINIKEFEDFSEDLVLKFSEFLGVETSEGIIMKSFSINRDEIKKLFGFKEMLDVDLNFMANERNLINEGLSLEERQRFFDANVEQIVSFSSLVDKGASVPNKILFCKYFAEYIRGNDFFNKIPLTKRKERFFLEIIDFPSMYAFELVQEVLAVVFFDSDGFLKKVPVLGIVCLSANHFTTIAKTNNGFALVDGRSVWDISVNEILEKIKWANQVKGVKFCVLV